ncbi:MAG: hypothetical protein ACOYL6_01995 [Bacteriovoracaceae bacterium]
MGIKLSTVYLLGFSAIILSSSMTKASSELISDALQKEVDKEVQYETNYEKIKSEWFSPRLFSVPLDKKITGLTQVQVPLLINILWNEQSQSESPLTTAFIDLYNYIPSLRSLSTKDRIHFIYTGLNTEVSSYIKRQLRMELYHIMMKKDLTTDEVMTLLSEYEGKKLSLLRLAAFRIRYHDESNSLDSISSSTSKYPTKEELKSLVEFKPDLTKFKKGIYQNSISVFLFCRSDRTFPCKMVMKDIHGDIVKNADGSIWTDQKLAKSAKNTNYTRANGHTPTGIYTMDSVMPDADQPLVYGKFRRVILNFIPSSTKETRQKSLMPEALQAYPWWKQAVVARNVGRGLLRIHGTGRVNQKPYTNYYPFTPSYGCLKSREGTYAGVEYKDQRSMLDQMMLALSLEPLVKNEVGIRGLLYVINLSNESKPVKNSDLQGIIDL